jgi:hypothetical protein
MYKKQTRLTSSCTWHPCWLAWKVLSASSMGNIAAVAREATWEPLGRLLLGFNCRGKWRTVDEMSYSCTSKCDFSISLALVCWLRQSRGGNSGRCMHRGTLLFSARWRSTLFKVYAGFFTTTLIDTRCIARRCGQITLQLPESEAYYRHIPIRCSCLEGCKQPADVARRYYILLM